MAASQSIAAVPPWWMKRAKSSRPSQVPAMQDYLRWRNAHARHPGVLAAQRRGRARIRSERPQRRGRPEP
jgi:hypothetical protein